MGRTGRESAYDNDCFELRIQLPPDPFSVSLGTGCFRCVHVISCQSESPPRLDPSFPLGKDRRKQQALIKDFLPHLGLFQCHFTVISLFPYCLQ